MRLGFDLDGVVVDLHSVLIKYLKEEFDVTWSHENFTDLHIYKLIFDADDKERNKKIQEGAFNFVFDNKCQFSAPPYKEAINVIKQLKRAGNSIHFITARHVEHKYDTAKWLRKYKVPFDSLNHVGSEHDIGKHAIDKGMIGRALNLDFYIDDEERHLESMIRYKKRWRKGLVLLDKPWNSDYIDGSKFIRLKTWEDVLRHLGIKNR
jgi:uncharacterized HAD superfamily protein